jgi:hypothetical protein
MAHTALTWQPFFYKSCFMFFMQQQGLPNSCKSRGCPSSKASKGEAVGFLLRVLGNAGDGVSSAFPPGKKHDKYFICFRSHQMFIRETDPNVF